MTAYAGNMLPDRRSEGGTWRTTQTEISARSHGIRPSGLISRSTSLTQVESLPLAPLNDHDRIRRKHAARPAKRGRNLEDRTNGNQGSLARNPPGCPDLAEHLPYLGRGFSSHTAGNERSLVSTYSRLPTENSAESGRRCLFACTAMSSRAPMIASVALSQLSRIDSAKPLAAGTSVEDQASTGQGEGW